MTKSFLTSSVLLAVLTLTACDPYPPTMRPDYTIKVVSTPKGDIAIPPTCPDYATNIQDEYDNQPQPQFGCATARNLALIVERPDDLVHGRELGPQRAVTAVGAIRRYDNNQTRGLVYPSATADTAIDATTSPTATSSMTGDVTGGGGSSGGGSAASGGAAAAAGP